MLNGKHLNRDGRRHTMTRFSIEADSQEEHRAYLAGPDLINFIMNWEDELRNKTKYGDGKLTSWYAVSDAWFQLKADVDSKLF